MRQAAAYVGSSACVCNAGAYAVGGGGGGGEGGVCALCAAGKWKTVTGSGVCERERESACVRACVCLCVCACVRACAQGVWGGRILARRRRELEPN